MHLHGSLNDFSKPLTFTLEDFAGQTTKPNSWYQALIEDMLSKTVVFIGTELSEPPFYHYLQLRTHREGGVQESRAKAFLVKPNISPIYRRQFQDQNFAVIDATAEEFFRTLIPAVQAVVPSRLDLLGNKHPHQIAAIRAGAYDTQAEVLRQFDFVAGDTTPTDRNTRTFFFEGAEPTWDDIRRNVDAQRDITSDYLQVLNDETHETSVVGLVGQAGSGKSTTVKRLAFEIARDGRIVYFSKTDQTLNQQAILDMARSLGDKHAYIFIDDARNHVLSVRNLIRELPAESKITFILNQSL